VEQLIKNSGVPATQASGHSEYFFGSSGVFVFETRLEWPVHLQLFFMCDPCGETPKPEKRLQKPKVLY
jgi:hypothetical protein